jgi:hypothetical protein
MFSHPLARHPTHGASIPSPRLGTGMGTAAVHAHTCDPYVASPKLQESGPCVTGILLVSRCYVIGGRRMDQGAMRGEHAYAW